MAWSFFLGCYVYAYLLIINAFGQLSSSLAHFYNVDY